ncbi:hypothetical protein PG991_003944 [Apiospora marii]|uniref:Uncharacterized protein n=1 Tax=Apiospora marii TaxID=335849 RepID=A0ABR1S4W0_9PEZI
MLSWQRFSSAPWGMSLVQPDAVTGGPSSQAKRFLDVRDFENFLEEGDRIVDGTFQMLVDSRNPETLLRHRDALANGLGEARLGIRVGQLSEELTPSFSSNRVSWGKTNSWSAGVLHTIHVLHEVGVHAYLGESLPQESI